jgi:hypothetical protein
MFESVNQFFACRKNRATMVLSICYDWYQLFRRLPQLLLDESRSDAAQESKLIRLPRADLLNTCLQGRNGELHQLFSRDQVE